MSEQVSEMTRDELKDLAKETAHEVLRGLGVDVDEPLEFQKDMAHVREWRKSSAAVKSAGLLAAVGVLVTGTLGALWLGIKSSLH